MTASTSLFFLGNSDEAGGYTFPMSDVTVGTVRMGAIEVQERSQVRVRPLLQRAEVDIDDQTAGIVRQLTIPLILTDGARASELPVAAQQLRESIGTEKVNLWIVDDSGQGEGLATTGGYLAGLRTVSYTPDATGWLANGDYLLYPVSSVGGIVGEVVVVGSLTSSTFAAQLQLAHATAQVCYRVAMVFPNAVLTGVRHSAAPLGKGSLLLTWLCPEAPLYGTTLPSDAG